MLSHGQDHEGVWLLVRCDRRGCSSQFGVRPGPGMTVDELVARFAGELEAANWWAVDDWDQCPQCVTRAGQGRSPIGSRAAHP
jgi:hypothetical protein